MTTRLPRIEGSEHDAALNTLIDFVNEYTDGQQEAFAAHAAAAIVKFLIVHHEVDVGTVWTKEVTRIVGAYPVADSFVDKLYHGLEARAMRSKALGCAARTLAMAGTPLFAAFAWWRLAADSLLESAFIGLGVLLVVPSVIQFVYALQAKGALFVGYLAQHVRLQFSSRRFWVPAMSTVALVLVPFTPVRGNPVAVIMVVCTWASTVIRWGTPPAVLVLGVSGSQSNALIPELWPALFPARILHLLRDDYANPERGYDTKLHTALTTSRSRGGTGWEGLVAQYLRMCEHTLVDLRKYSANLEMELSMIGSLPDDLRRRVIYLAASEAESPALPFDPGHEQRVCHSTEEAIRRLGVRS